MKDSKLYSQKTRTIQLGRNPDKHMGTVNPPLFRASTILFPTVEDFLNRRDNLFSRDKLHYGLTGTPTSFALEDTVSDLEGGYRGVISSSGLSAICIALLANLKSGDHLLMVDTAYDPTQYFCGTLLKNFSVETTYYPPGIGADIEQLIRKNTRVVFLESPGSLTFEVQDIPAICDAVRAKNIVTIIDNTWATPLYLKPFDLGVDISIHAATKYIMGHSDGLLGIATCNESTYERVKKTAISLGQTAGPEDMNLALRGIRTLASRLDQHQQQALEIAEWLKRFKVIKHVLHPALPDCPGHEFWKRDYTGSSGLFAIEFDHNYDKTALAAFVDDMELFGIGASWGGFESLIIPASLENNRVARPWRGGSVLRLHIGLEDTDDLKKDLQNAFDRLEKHLA